MDIADDKSTSQLLEAGITKGFDWIEHHKISSLAITIGGAALAIGAIADGSVLGVAARDITEDSSLRSVSGGLAGLRSLGKAAGDIPGVSSLGATAGNIARLDALEVRPMITSDLPNVMKLVEKTEGLAFRPEETCAALERALKMNPGLSQVAVAPDNQVVGGVFVGETGLRGMINHLAVDPAARGSGIGTELVQRGLQELYETTPVRRVYASVLADNENAMKFWSNLGRQATGRGVGEEVVTYIIDLDKQPWLNGPLGS